MQKQLWASATKRKNKCASLRSPAQYSQEQVFHSALLKLLLLFIWIAVSGWHRNWQNYTRFSWQSYRFLSVAYMKCYSIIIIIIIVVAVITNPFLHIWNWNGVMILTYYGRSHKYLFFCNRVWGWRHDRQALLDMLAHSTVHSSIPCLISFCDVLFQSWCNLPIYTLQVQYSPEIMKDPGQTESLHRLSSGNRRSESSGVEEESTWDMVPYPLMPDIGN